MKDVCTQINPLSNDTPHSLVMTMKTLLQKSKHVTDTQRILKEESFVVKVTFCYTTQNFSPFRILRVAVTCDLSKMQFRCHNKCMWGVIRERRESTFSLCFSLALCKFILQQMQKLSKFSGAQSFARSTVRNSEVRIRNSNDAIELVFSIYVKCLGVDFKAGKIDLPYYSISLTSHTIRLSTTINCRLRRGI